MLEVRRRGGFSDRNGIKPENSEMQLTSLDERTRAALVGVFSRMYNKAFGDYSSSWNDTQEFFRFVWGEIFAQPVDYRRLYNPDDIIGAVNTVITKHSYDDVLTVVEALCEYFEVFFQKNHLHLNQYVSCLINEVLEKEYVGYRYVNKMIVPISDHKEVESINESFYKASNLVCEHLDKALGFLSDRNNPDYENSIKESITAVEAMCEEITGIRGKTATLSAMLKKLDDNGVVIHSALKSAFGTLYGYTNDANGIRHAGDIGGPNSTFEEAKFMLVSCCAFINYLVGVQAK